MHSAQKMYNEELDSCVKMVEHLISVLETPGHDENAFPDGPTFYNPRLVNKHNHRI